MNPKNPTRFAENPAREREKDVLKIQQERERRARDNLESLGGVNEMEQGGVDTLKVYLYSGDPMR